MQWVSADGTETPVLDWADMTANADSALPALLSWNPSSSDTTAHRVRDATHPASPGDGGVSQAVLGRIRPAGGIVVAQRESCWSYRYR